MKAFKFIWTRLFVVLMCANLSSCSGDDEKIETPTNWNPHFSVGWSAGNNLLSGETCTYTDDLRSHEIRISPDENLDAEKRNEFWRHDIYFMAEGVIEITSESAHSVFIKFKEPGIGKLTAHDYTANQKYYIDIVVKAIDVKNNITIYQKENDGWYDENRNFHDGPFLRIKTTDVFSKFGVNGRLKIVSFGSDSKEFKPSKEDFGWSTDLKSNGDGSYSYNGDFYMGKVNTTRVNYWFYKFVYGSTLHEVRKYNGSDKCLWNGEWNR